MGLSSTLSIMIIGRLAGVMRSEVCIAKLAQFLHRRRILNTEEYKYFSSKQSGPNAETEKLSSFQTTLAKVAEYPNAECIKHLYLALMDSFDDNVRECDGHFGVANYLRKQSEFFFCFLKTMLMAFILFYCSTKQSEYIR